MSNFTDTPIAFCIWKDLLPEVHESQNGQPFVKIPDPDNPGETIHFISLPGDGAEELFTLAAAYLALAQHAETVQGQAVARDWLNPANTNS